MATLYYAKHVHITQTRTQDLYFCTGQESKSESVSESVSGNVYEPLDTEEFLPAKEDLNSNKNSSHFQNIL